MYATVGVYDASPDLADALAARADDVKQLVSGIDVVASGTRWDTAGTCAPTRHAWIPAADSPGGP
jgi:hypothetical protein